MGWFWQNKVGTYKWIRVTPSEGGTGTACVSERRHSRCAVAIAADPVPHLPQTLPPPSASNPTRPHPASPNNRTPCLHGVAALLLPRHPEISRNELHPVRTAQRSLQLHHVSIDRAGREDSPPPSSGVLHPGASSASTLKQNMDKTFTQLLHRDVEGSRP